MITTKQNTNFIFVVTLSFCFVIKHLTNVVYCNCWNKWCQTQTELASVFFFNYFSGFFLTKIFDLLRRGNKILIFLPVMEAVLVCSFSNFCIYSSAKSEARSKHFDISSSRSTFLYLLVAAGSLCKQRPFTAYDSATIFKLLLKKNKTKKTSFCMKKKLFYCFNCD